MKKSIFTRTLMKEITALLVAICIAFLFPGYVKAAESDENTDLELLFVKEEDVDYFGEPYTKRVYEVNQDKTVYIDRNLQPYGEGQKIVRVEYISRGYPGSNSIYGTDSTQGVSYTLTLNYSYEYHNGIKYCKPTSTTCVVDLGPDGTQLNYQYFVLYNTGFTYGNTVGDYVYYTPSYYRYSTNASCSAPSYFEYATKWDGGSFPGNYVDYTLYLKRGNSYWSATDSVSCD